ncbi:MAG: glycosyltransferase family 2 protein [Spirochaetota bacterium]
MQKQKALVSVIIPNFNRVESFQRAVESVIKQTYENFEIIVVDDGSEQSVRNINRRFLEKVKRRKYFEGDGKVIYLENERNFGVSYSRNKGIKEAKGDFIALLDSDDEWLEQKLELQVKFFDKTNFRVVHTEEIWVRRGVRVNPMKKHKKEGGDIFFRSLELCLMSPSSIMLKKSIFDDYGYFDESLPVCEDYDLWLRITSKENVGFIESPLIIKYGGHSDQLSRKYEAMDRWRVISLIKLLNSKQLSELQEIEVKKIIEKKAKILYNGAVKRKRYDDAKVYKKWMEEFLL